MRNAASFPLRSPQPVCSPAGSDGTPKGIIVAKISFRIFIFQVKKTGILKKIPDITLLGFILKWINKQTVLQQLCVRRFKFLFIAFFSFCSSHILLISVNYRQYFLVSIIILIDKSNDLYKPQPVIIWNFWSIFCTAPKNLFHIELTCFPLLS